MVVPARVEWVGRVQIEGQPVRGEALSLDAPSGHSSHLVGTVQNGAEALSRDMTIDDLLLPIQVLVHHLPGTLHWVQIFILNLPLHQPNTATPDFYFTLILDCIAKSPVVQFTKARIDCDKFISLFT